MKYFSIFFTWFFLLFFFSPPSRAQENNVFNLNIDNGLPSNHVYGAITDKHGYLWIATPKGVARYNGYDFKLFNLSEGLPYEDIWELLEDKKGRIWLGNISSELGYIYNNKYHKSYLKGIKGTLYPKDMRVFGDGITFSSLYINGVTPTICIEHNDTIIPYKINEKALKPDVIDAKYNANPILLNINKTGNPIVLANNNIYELNIANNNHYIDKVLKLDSNANKINFSTCDINLISNYLLFNNSNYLKSNKLDYINLSNGAFTELNLNQWKVKDNIEYIYIDQQNKSFYLIENKFILKFSYDKNITYVNTFLINSISKNNTLDGTIIKTFKESDFWNTIIGTTTKGLFIKYNYKKSFFNYNKIDIDNFKYVGGIIDKVQFWWNANKNTLIRLKHNEINTYKLKKTDDIYSVIPFSGDTALIVGRICYYSKMNSNNLIQTNRYFEGAHYSAFVEDRESMYMINHGSFYNIIYKNDSIIKRIIDPDRYKNFVFDSIRGQYWVYNIDKILLYTKKEHHSIRDAQLQKFGIKKVEGIAIDNKYGNIFFKGQNNITQYNPEKNVYQELFKDFNLQESSVYVYNNTLIVAGRFGILFNKILDKDKLSKYLLYANIKNANYNYILDCQISWGKILLSTDKGTYEVTIPSDSEITNCAEDSLVNKYNVVLNYKDSIFNIIAGDTIRINQKDLRLQFDIINPAGNGLLKYNYRLPSDSVWHELNTNELNLPAFAPDNYYKITITAHDNVWRSDDIYLYVYVKPYWWQTHTGKRIVWITSIALIFLFLTMLILVTRKLAIRATQKRNLQMEMELKSIYSQINPHFIFNTLNSALLLVSKNKMEEAYTHISKFSRLLRSYIKSSRNKLITIAEEISNLKNYIELQQTRFKSKFEYSIIVDGNISTDQTKIPSLLLQPFVENAINHGILNREGAGHLKIEFKNSGRKGEIICIIEDDGVGRKSSKLINQANIERGESYGDLLIKDLVNIFNKYEQMNIEITYTDKEEPLTGTIVTIRIKSS